MKGILGLKRRGSIVVLVLSSPASQTMSSEQAQDTCIDCQTVSQTEEPASSRLAAPKNDESSFAKSILRAGGSAAVQEDVMNPATFPLPNLSKEVHVVIEYCNRW